MPIPITLPALLSKLWGTSVNNALSALSAGAQSADEVEVIAESVADAKFAAVSVDLTDATMTATAETPSSDFAQHLNGTIAAGAKSAPYRSTSILAVGDSITSYNRGATAAVQNPGWFWRLLSYARGRLQPSGEGIYATAGYTCAQVLSTHVPQVEALSVAPGWVFIACGANDLSATGGTPYSTDPTVAQQAHKDIIDRVQTLGAVPVLVKVPPNSTSSLIASNVVHWNAYIEALGRERRLPVLDMCAPLATNPAVADTWKSGVNQDAVHPNAVGHDYIAKHAVATGFLDIFGPPTSFLGPTWFTQLVTDAQGRFTADANADGLADGWSTGGTTTGVTFARDAAVAGDDAFGFWQVINVPAAIAGGGWIQRGAITTGWSVGDRIRLRARIQLTGITGATSAQGFSAQILFLSPQTGGGWQQWNLDMVDGCVDVTIAAPSASTQIYIRFSWNSGGPAYKVRIANVRLENLSVSL